MIIKSEKKLREKPQIAYELSTLFQQQPNERLLYMVRTRLWFHYKFQEKNGRFARWVMKKVAENPTVYDSTAAEKTCEIFASQMHLKGYFDATCAYKSKKVGKRKMKTTYTLRLGNLYRIEDVVFTSKDTAIQRILNETRGDTYLERGQAVDSKLFDSEKLRLTSEIKNRGYAYFVPNFMEVQGDSTNHKVKIKFEVQPQNDTLMHETYRVNQVSVFSSLTPNFSLIRQDTTINGIYMATSETKFRIRPSLLSKAITIKPGALYHQQEFDRTYKNLSQLGIFRFVAIRPMRDSVNTSLLNANISFVPVKRFSMGPDFDFNYSNSSTTPRLFGASSGIYLRNRNLFRGAENLQTDLRYGVEFDIRQGSSFIFSQEAKFGTNMTIPRFFDYFGLWRGLNKIGRKKGGGIVPDRLLARLREDAFAKLSLNYNYFNLTDLYQYQLFNASFGYDLQTDPSNLYTIDHFGIDIIKPRITGIFTDPFFNLTFSDQLLSGFILRNFSYTHFSKTNRFGERWGVRFNSELSGLEVFLANQTWSGLFGKQYWNAGGLDYSKFWLLNFDASYTRDFKKGLTGVVHFGTGAILPFDLNQDNLPYVKLFYVGGPSSLRGWRIRQLGPGGFYDPENENLTRFFEASNFRMEFNGELRFDLFWWFKGAVFVDGGNIWSIFFNETRQNGKLSWDAYKQIAINTGFGIRGDFNYFVLRFDLGLPLRRPYTTENNSNWIYSRWSQLRLSELNPNLAVGFPF